MPLLPMASSPDGLISAPVCGHHKDPRLGGARHNQQRVLGGGGVGCLVECALALQWMWKALQGTVGTCLR